MPGWIRLGADKEDPKAAAADQKYLDWLDDEWHGYERGNPPGSRELDEVINAASTHYPEQKDRATEVQRGPAGHWEFEDWAQAHGYSEGDVATTYDLETARESRLAQREGQEMVDEIQRIADDRSTPMFAIRSKRYPAT